MTRARLRIRLRGIVQGVGFRPFVHKLALRYGLDGFVLNSSTGLTAEVEGGREELGLFLAALGAEAPPLSWIQETASEELPPTGETGFAIRASVAATGEFALISPDVATCAECLREIDDPADRRYGYPFTNCTHCGPRFTIIGDIPYDRATTTMARFTMCTACQAEYDDPANRRFHAQPNACPACGPRLSGSIAEAQQRLWAGEILAIKGLGGFHLACHARDEAAVRRLRERKRRSDKPFAVMARDLAVVEGLCEADEEERALLAGPAHPIVILAARAPWPAVAPGNPTLGIMLPYTPLHHLLFRGAPYDALVMTSGNVSEEPIVVDNDDARGRLGGVADWFLTHDRDISMRADDSVVRRYQGAARVLRRSRGYAPQTLDLGRTVPELLAVGGELKNAFCLTKGQHAILSQHIGDLENYETLVFLEETLANLKKLFRVEPRVVAHDLHPGYLSTRYALGLAGLPAIGVQHHHAHIAGCMLEHGLEGEVTGVAFDGTGYGTDGAIWGGEFLQTGYAGFTRRAHIRYAPLAGGDAAVREPWRAALAYVPRMEGVAEEKQRVVRRMIETGLNTVPTSSCGRLFDAVAALTGLRREVNFEGQAAIELEAIADPSVETRYEFCLSGEELDFRPALAEIAVSREGVPAIAARFHNTVASAIVATCRAVGLPRVCLSGGTFQNAKLLARTLPALERAGFTVYLHEKVPCNDGGLALGQAAVAAWRMEAGG